MELTPDDRDSLAFKDCFRRDFIPEKIEYSARTIKGKLRNNIDTKGSWRFSLQTFRPPSTRVLHQGRLAYGALRPDNPIQMMAGHRKTTLMSTELGGIKNEHSLTDEMQGHQPQPLWVLGPDAYSESDRTGITSPSGPGCSQNGKDLETPAYNLKTGKLEYIKASDFDRYTQSSPTKSVGRMVSRSLLPMMSRLRALRGHQVHHSVQHLTYCLPQRACSISRRT